MLPIKVVSQRVTKVRAEILVLGIFQNVRPLKGLVGDVDWIHQGVLSHLILDGKISGRARESTLLATQNKLPASKVLVMGLGKLEEFSMRRLQRAYENTLDKLIQLQAKHCVMELFGLLECPFGSSESLMVLLEVINKNQVWRDLTLFLLIDDDQKARQVEQQLAALSVSV